MKRRKKKSPVLQFITGAFTVIGIGFMYAVGAARGWWPDIKNPFSK